MSTPEPVLPQEETIQILLERSKRPNRAVPIRATFVQKGSGKQAKPGPLAGIVNSGNERALDLYLLLLAVASAGDYSVTEWANTWARSLGLLHEASGQTAVSRGWRRLEQANLIRRERGAHNHAKITVLREDGEGGQYTHPGERKDGRREFYLQLPFEFWLADERWHQTLRLPAKAMLLVALSTSTKAEFILPMEWVPSGYGVSSDTALRGLSQLQERGLLVVVGSQRVRNLKSKTGYSDRHIYTLQPPFDVVRRGLGRTRKAAK